MKKFFYFFYFVASCFLYAKTYTDRLLVINKDEGSVWAIDVASGEVISKIDVDDGPHEIASSPDGKIAVVGNYFWNSSPKNSLKVIDVVTSKVIKSIDLSPYRMPQITKNESADNCIFPISCKIYPDGYYTPI